MSASSWNAISGRQPVRSYWALLGTITLGFLAGAAAVFGGWLSAAAVIVAALFIRWPVAVALGLFCMLVPFDNVSAIGAGATGVALTRYVAAFATLVLVVVGLAARRLSFPPGYALWWSLFVLWGIATVAWAVDPQLAWGRLPTAVSLLVLFLVCTSFRISRDEFAAALTMTVFGGFAAALFCATRFFQGALFRGTVRGSLVIAGRETDPNQFAASLLLPFSLAVAGIVWGRSRLLRSVAIAAASILALGVLLTMSRGGLLAMLVVVTLYILRVRFGKGLLIVIACLALLLALLPRSFYTRLALADRGAGRLDIWAASVELLPRYGIFGAGWDNFTTIYSQVAGSAPKFHGYTEGAHNIYLGLTLEVGAVGLLLLLLAFRSQLRRARQLSLLPYVAACWGMLTIAASLDVAWRKSFWLCWIFLAMATRLQEDQLDLSYDRTRCLSHVPERSRR